MFPPPIPTAAPSSPAPSAAPENGTPSTPVACEGDAPSPLAAGENGAPAAPAALAAAAPVSLGAEESVVPPAPAGSRDSASAFPRAGRARAAGRSVSRETFRFSGRPLFSARFPSRLLAVLAAMALAVTCVGCSGANGTAATVNGTAIPEQAVTDYVQSLRAAQGLEDGAAWKAYLEDSGQTSEGVRDQVIDVLVSREIMRQGASELGVRVTGEELDEAVAVKRRTYESDEQWRAALAAAGLDEKSFREETELDLLSAKVTQALAEDPSLAYEATRDTDDSAYDKVGDAASGAGDAVQDEAALESARTQAALAWIADLRARADITVNPFPNGLPY